MIRLSGVCKRFGDVEAVRGVSFEAADGSVLGLLGPNGAGKTTTLRLLTGLMRPDAGAVVVDGLDVVAAPVDVQIGDRATPVQPDIVFVARERLHIVGRERIEGAPDLVVEILSRSTAARDRGLKFDLYAASGVREYWLADPDERTLEVYVLRGQAYAPLGSYRPGEVAASELLPSLKLKVKELFED